MSDPLVLYTNPMSRGRMARWMLEELGQPYETVLMEYGPPMKTPDYLALNPMGKVPTLKHGDAVVTETGAIIAYLADAFPEAGLAPRPGDPARAAYLRWMFFAAGPLEDSTVASSMGVEIPENMRGRVGYGSLRLVMDAIERAVMPGPYLLGDSFSAVDLYLGGKLAWAMMMGAIEKRPVFEQYTDRLMARPAQIRASEIDDALIKLAG